jgi:hypothetical protein
MQCSHRLDVPLVGRRSLPARLHIDPQEPAGVLERGRHEHLAVVDDDRGRHHHRSGRGVLQPLVQARQPAPRQRRPRHGKGLLRPPRAHRLGGDGPRQQQTGVHRLGRGPQHRRGHRPGRDIHMPVSSHFPITPSACRTSTSSGVESICINSPGAHADTCPNAPDGREATERRVVAEPVVCRPADNSANNRYQVRRDGSRTSPEPEAHARSRRSTPTSAHTHSCGAHRRRTQDRKSRQARCRGLYRRRHCPHGQIRWHGRRMWPCCLSIGQKE